MYKIRVSWICRNYMNSLMDLDSIGPVPDPRYYDKGAIKFNGLKPHWLNKNEWINAPRTAILKPEFQGKTIEEIKVMLHMRGLSEETV